MSQSSLRESMNKNNVSNKNQLSVRAIATGYNKRGISTDSRQDQNRYNLSNNLDSLSNLITQQVEFRPNTSSPMNNTGVSNSRSVINSPRQNDHLRMSTTISPSNRIMAQNPKQVISSKFLPNQTRDKIGKKTLILDLDETLVHSAFKPFSQRSDILLNVELDKKIHIIHVLKRPGAEEFIERMSNHYEVVIFTASLSAYANPLIDQLDIKRCCSYRLFREHCTSLNGVFIKDMSKLGRDLKDVIIVDNNPGSFSFHKDNGIPIKTWYSDKSDRDLYNLAPILERLAYVKDIRDHLKKFCCNNEVNYKVANSHMLNSEKNDRQQLQDNTNNNSYFNNSGSNFHSKNNSKFLENAKQNSYGSRLIDGFEKHNLTNNNIMPVNKKIGFDTKNNPNNSSLLKNRNIEVEELSFDRKSILPANKFPENSENLKVNTSKNTNINSKLINRSFNNFKNNFDEEKTDLNNPNISINIVNHNYSHHYYNPDKANLNLSNAVIPKENSAIYNRNQITPNYNLNSNMQGLSLNRSPATSVNNSNILSMNQENYEEKEKSKYSNINLFRGGNNSNKNNQNNQSTKNSRINERKDSYKRNTYSDNFNTDLPSITNQMNYFSNFKNEKLNSNQNSSQNLNKNQNINQPINSNNVQNLNQYQNGNVNNFNKNLLKQNQDRAGRVFNNLNENMNSDVNQYDANQRYNSFLSEKYSSKISTSNRPSSAVLIGHGNSNHLSRYPLSSQQIQSFINNNSNQTYLFNTPKEQYNSNKPNFDKKSQMQREHSAANMRSSNYISQNPNNGSGYINMGYYQINQNYINNAQKQKYGNNLTSSLNNFDLDYGKNTGNRTTRPGTSLNDNKNGMIREFSIGTPKRQMVGNYASNFHNMKTPVNNYGFNKSFNGLNSKDLGYEDFSNRESIGKANNANNNIMISKSVERTKFKPSTPSYQTNNIYFSSNNNQNNMMYQKQTNNNYSSSYNNLSIYQDSKNIKNGNAQTSYNYRSIANNNQNNHNQSNYFHNKSIENKNYENYYNSNQLSKYENKLADYNSNFSQSMRERFYPVGGNI